MKLRDWLKANRYTVSEFSRQIGKDRSYIHTWMSGKRIPSRRVREAVMRFTKGEVVGAKDLRS